MGFGTLFIGCFFLLNISYYGYTDVIAAMIMMMGLFKLSVFCKELKLALYASYVFALLSLGELVISVIELFGISASLGSLLSYIACIRYIVIFALSYLILTGILSLAKEVDDKVLAERAKRMSIFAFLYLVLAIFELPMIGTLLGSIVGYVYFALILLYITLIVFLLVTVYKAYMGICMPEDNLPKRSEPSKIGFVNRFREHEEQKEREYAEYRKKKLESKQNIKKGKK